jgi:hypothetical protein
MFLGSFIRHASYLRLPASSHKGGPGESGGWMLERVGHWAPTERSKEPRPASQSLKPLCLLLLFLVELLVVVEFQDCFLLHMLHSAIVWTIVGWTGIRGSIS